MVLWQGDGLALPAEDRPGIACVGDVEGGGGHEDDIGSATDGSSDVLLLLGVGDLLAGSNFVEGQLPLGALDHLIDPFEGLVEGYRELACFVVGIGHEFLGEDISNVLADLEAWVGEGVPPCPSKTAKRALPSPILGLWIAASSMFLRQPEWAEGYLAFRLRRRRSRGLTHRQSACLCSVLTDIHPLLIFITPTFCWCFQICCLNLKFYFTSPPSHLSSPIPTVSPVWL